MAVQSELELFTRGTPKWVIANTVIPGGRKPMPLYVDPKTFHEVCRVYSQPLPGTIPWPEYREMERLASLEQVIETDVVYVKRKLCSSQNVVKDGVRGGIQYYWCKKTASGNSPGPKRCPT
jgi:hypothetical protein